LRIAWLGLTLLAGGAVPALASEGPQNFVFFNVERQRIHEDSFLQSAALVGAQLKYRWRELEPERDVYRFDLIASDLRFLEAHGKKLFIQIQEVSFSPDIVNVHDYLREDPAFGGGVQQSFDVEDGDVTTATPGGWVPRRWDPQVRERFLLLIGLLGRRFDGKIAGVNLPETSIGFGAPRFYPDDFSNEGYTDSVIAIMSGTRKAFARSDVIQYANFMPGEWLPGKDKGYLKRIYAHADEIRMGVGGPDLLPFRRGQNNHAYPLIKARGPQTVAGVAVQWGNFDDINPATGNRTTVEEIFSFAKDELDLDYLFWGTQEPYYSEEVIPYLEARLRP
jgi:hypothetical protein